MSARALRLAPLAALLLAGSAAAEEGTLRILLARHGQTAWNAAGRLQGRTDVPLDATGRAQADSLAARLAGVTIDHVYSSILARSRATAERVAGGRRLTSLPGLDEQALGRFEGMRTDTSDRAQMAEFERRRRDPEDTLEGGESAHEHLGRVRSVLVEMRARHPSGTVLIVGHGGTNRMILRVLLGLTAAEAETVRQANDELYLIEWPAAGRARLWKWIARERLAEL